MDGQWQTVGGAKKKERKPQQSNTDPPRDGRAAAADGTPSAFAALDASWKGRNGKTAGLLWPCTMIIVTSHAASLSNRLSRKCIQPCLTPVSCFAGAHHLQSSATGNPQTNGVSGAHGVDGSTDDGGSSEASAEQLQQQGAKRKKPKAPKAKKPTPASAAAAMQLGDIASVSMHLVNSVAQAQSAVIRARCRRL